MDFLVFSTARSLACFNSPQSHIYRYLSGEILLIFLIQCCLLVPLLNLSTTVILIIFWGHPGYIVIVFVVLAICTVCGGIVYCLGSIHLLLWCGMHGSYLLGETPVCLIKMLRMYSFYAVYFPLGVIIFRQWFYSIHLNKFLISLGWPYPFNLSRNVFCLFAVVTLILWVVIDHAWPFLFHF